MSITCVILAAGQSARFGKVKALAEFQEKTLIDHALTAAKLSECCDVHVVLGAHKRVIENNINSDHYNLIYNPDHNSGMASSIKLAVTTLKEHDALLFITVDQPLVQAKHLNQLISMHKKFGNRMVAAKYSGSVGIPAIFPRNYYNALMRLEGDKGAKKLLTTTTILKVELPQAQFDIDLPAELEVLEKSTKD